MSSLVDVVKEIIGNISEDYIQVINEFETDSKHYGIDLDEPDVFSRVLSIVCKYVVDKMININLEQFVRQNLRIIGSDSYEQENKEYNGIINISSILDTKDDIQKDISYLQLYKKFNTAVYTDTYATANSDLSELTWNVVHQKTTLDGSIVFPNDIDKIYAIKIYDYYISPTVNIDTGTTGYKSADLNYGKHSILIKEFAGQSFVTGDRKFHFWGSFVPCVNKFYGYGFSKRWSERQPYVKFEHKTADIGLYEFDSRSKCSNNLDGIFVFDPPVQPSGTFTLSFANPITPYSTLENKSIIAFELLYLPNI